MAMGKAEWGRLTHAWKGEATDFTPELANHLETLDEDLGLGLADATIEVPATGGRRIDILASGSDGTRYVIENQYGRGDHDHLTRGLAYAVSAEAGGLIVVAEDHRDEFRDVVHYLNDIAARSGTGIKVWLVEARAVRVDGGPWAPVFTVVAEPSAFLQEMAGNIAGRSRSASVEVVLDVYADEHLRHAAAALVSWWKGAGFKVNPLLRGGKHLIGLHAPGPSANGMRSVVTVYPDGRVFVPLGAYQGKNSGIAVEDLTGDDFVRTVKDRFSLSDGYTPEGWFTPEKLPLVQELCGTVADAYASALDRFTVDQ
ncbi:hypothetical protein GCM10010401_17560 [Rarobacter faecitabidus]|uniref:DUF4268 domain-containing protein n=1 Tax=Rarobacter faecitabidus TaxID=13243 RepID=A0A542ZUF2_RARFA|nr:hypothetical protein [Rarobacter faecitabidus]TQL63967.1 hypothetical protein FB461_0448 [Rarobacter faecitabidus]